MITTNTWAYVRNTLAAFGVAVLGAGIFGSVAQARADRLDSERRFEIPAQPLATALVQFSRQAEVQLVTSSIDLGTHQTSGVSGQLSIRRALESLLDRTGLSYSLVGDNTVAIVPASAALVSAADGKGAARAATKSATQPVAQSVPASSATMNAAEDIESEAPAPREQELPAPGETEKAIPEFLVTGSRSLNMDIRRTRDDVQPYVILDRDTIERSGASTVGDLLKDRLTMNTVGRSGSQAGAGSTPNSQINLRGLGANQTLILIDGHRTPIGNGGGNLNQTDLNGIPLAAIERIEILPTTASGIYGGSATGGAVNIILRRDYSGLESKLTYENTFDGDAAQRRVDLSGGLTLEEGKTNILFAASYADANVLAAQDRDFVERGFAAARANNPGAYFPLTAPFPAPPLGATTNIRSASTTATGALAPLTLDDGTPLNSTYTFVPVGYAGPASDGGQALRANAGQYNVDLGQTAQTGGGRSALLNTPTVESIMMTVRRQFTDRIEAFVDGFATNNHGAIRTNAVPSTFNIAAGAPNNPFQQNIQVRVPIGAGDGDFEVLSADRRLAGGIITRLPGNWSAETDFTWDRSRWNITRTNGGVTTATTAAIQNGSLDVLRDLEAFPLSVSLIGPLDSYVEPPSSTLKDATLRAAGPVWQMPGGAATLSGLIEYRDEELSSTSLLDSTGTVLVIVPSVSQTIKSAYIETKLPLFSERNARPGLRELELQLAGRHDRYTINGAPTIVSPTAPIDRRTNQTDSTDYTVGFKYAPIPDLVFRASYGTGFLPPALNQLVPFSSSDGDIIFDPRRGNTPVNPSGTRIPTLRGGNADLEPEDSESWSAGLILTPRFAPGLRLSVDYTRIQKSDNIEALTTQAMVNNEAFLPDRIVRAASCPGDPFSPVCPITLVDLSLANISKVKVEAYDAQLDYSLSTERAGTFDLFAVGTWQTHHQKQLTPDAPVVENVGTNVISSVPLELKWNAGVAWKYEGWTLGWSTRYLDSYLVATSPVTIASQGRNGQVSSQIYHDAVGTYRFASNAPSLLSDLEIQLGIKNVFDEAPSFDASNTATYYSFLGDPRLRTYYLSLRKGFF